MLLPYDFASAVSNGKRFPHLLEHGKAHLGNGRGVPQELAEASINRR